MKPREAIPSKKKQNGERLLRGLYRRGKVLWVNKKIDGKRHQFSTETSDIDEAVKVLEEFLRSSGVHNRQPPATHDRPPLPRGLYWKGPVIWLSRVVDGKHYNQSTGTSDPKLAEQYLADFNLRAFKGEQLGVKVKPRVAFEALAEGGITCFDTAPIYGGSEALLGRALRELRVLDDVTVVTKVRALTDEQFADPAVAAIAITASVDASRERLGLRFDARSLVRHVAGVRPRSIIDPEG